MSSRRFNVLSQLDWPTLLVVLQVLGWLNIVGAPPAEVVDRRKAGKQLIWMGVTYWRTARHRRQVYITSVLSTSWSSLLAAVLVVEKRSEGALWLGWAALAFSRVNLPKRHSCHGGLVPEPRRQPWRTLAAAAIPAVALPAGLILLQPDAGTVLVFGGLSLCYREGLSGNVLLIAGGAGVGGACHPVWGD